jgi:lipoate-protein ligase A
VTAAASMSPEAPACRLLPYRTADGPWNMAADEVLLEAAEAGNASLRLYGWSEPTLSLGYFQAEEPTRANPRLAELPRVRRATGGAALVHHHELTYALALPAGPPWQRVGQSWLRRLHAVLIRALADLGVPAEGCDVEQGAGRALCFLHHTPGDLRIGLAKVVGSAQRKRRGALLQHGGILLAASPFTPELPGIRELSGQSLSPEQVQAAFLDSLVRDTGWRLVPSDWSAAELLHVEQLRRDRYTQDAWNRKR